METDEELPGFARWLFECTSIVAPPTKKHKRRVYCLDVHENYDEFLKDAGDALAMLPQIKSLVFLHLFELLRLELHVLHEGYQILTIHGPYDKVGEQFKKMLTGNTTVEKLMFCARAFEKLSPALETMRNVQWLRFFTPRRSTSMIEQTLKLLEEPGRLLTTLKMTSYIDKSVGKGLVSLITRASNLKSLTFDCFLQNEEASCLIFPALKLTNSLEKLRVGDCEELDKSAPLLIDALRVNRTLVSIEVGQIPEALFFSTLDVFRTNCTLRRLRCKRRPIYILSEEDVEEAERILSEAYVVVEIPKMLPESPVIKERLERNEHNHAMRASSLVAVMLDFLEEWAPKHQYQSSFDTLSLGFKQRRTLALSANIQ